MVFWIQVIKEQVGGEGPFAQRPTGRLVDMGGWNQETFWAATQTPRYTYPIDKRRTSLCAQSQFDHEPIGADGFVVECMFSVDRRSFLGLFLHLRRY